MDLQTLMDLITIGDVVGLIIGLGAVWAGIKWLLPAGRAITEFLNDWAGEPERPGVPARPGVMEQLSDLRTEVDLAKVLAHDAAESSAAAAFHSQPNHGSSSYDALMLKLEKNIKASRQAVAESVEDRRRIRQHMSELSEQIRAVTERFDTHVQEASGGEQN